MIYWQIMNRKKTVVSENHYQMRNIYLFISTMHYDNKEILAQKTHSHILKLRCTCALFCFFFQNYFQHIMKN